MGLNLCSPGNESPAAQAMHAQLEWHVPPRAHAVSLAVLTATPSTLSPPQHHVLHQLGVVEPHRHQQRLEMRALHSGGRVG